MGQNQQENIERTRAIYKARTMETAKELAEAGFEFPEVDFALRLENETDSENRAYNGSVYWLELKNAENGRLKAGKLFLPKTEFGCFGKIIVDK